MSDNPKPQRKTIRLKTKEAEPGAPGQGKKRPPVRWSPLQRDRARASEDKQAKPAAEPAKKRPATAKSGRGAEQRNADHKNEGRTRRRTIASKPQTARLQHFFAACPRGLEAETAKELAELGAEEIREASGGVEFSGELPIAWKVNLWSRLAIRVLQRIDTGSYRDEDDLYRATLKLPWSDWFGVDRSIAVRTVAHASPLKSLNFATLKIKDAVCDRFRQDLELRPDVDARSPQMPILLYLDRDNYSLYLDLSGEPLNRRGYRIEPAPAPLNENLAAGLLRLAGWTPDRPLLDPMMGGGTILLEAAMMALNMAPGLKRHFAFENLISFDKVEWARLRKDAQAAQQEKRELPIYGCDIDPKMVRAAGINLKAAGLLDCVILREGDVLEIPAPADSGLIVSNPPYGIRLESDAAFYSSLGDAMKQHFPGWTAYFISADPEFPKNMGLKADRRIPLYNGPLECRLYEYRMVSGSMRQ